MAPGLTRSLAVALVAFGVVASAGAGDDKKPFAVADLYRLVGVEEPAIAPDGSAIVYTVTSSDLGAMKRTSSIWRIAPDGSGARALTTSDASDSSPAFSADGRTLAFVSTRSGEPQVWFLPWDGGEARKVTSWPGGVGSYLLSPDGRHLAFTADVWVSCGGDAECNRAIDKARDGSKLKAHLADRLLYRHWNEWRDGRRTHIMLQNLATGAVRDLTPGDFDSPVFSVGGGADFAFSPDGKELVFASNRDRDEASSTNADLWSVAVDAPADALGAPRRLTDNPAWDGGPAFSPDGRLLAYRTQKLPGCESDRARIAVRDRATGAVRVLTEGFDNTISDLAWSRDGERIFFKAEVRGRTPLHELDLASGGIRVVTDVGQVDAFAVAPDASWAVVSRRRVGSPQELHIVTIRPEPCERRLTTHNAAVEAEVDIRPAEEIFVPGAGGKPVQVFIVTPHGFDPAKKYPLILNIHGGPQSQWTDSFRGDWQVYPGAGYVVAFPNPHGSYGFGEAYTAAISRDWNGKVMDDIARVTDALAALPYVDASRMGVMGWSWGGYAVMWLQGHSTRYKAMAAMMGVYDLRSMYSSTEELWFPEWDLGGAPWENREHYRTASPSEAVEGFRTPCLVITGQKDFRVPYTQSLMFFTDLQKRGVPSRLLVFENAGHWPAWYEMALYYTAHLDWFARHLGGGRAPWDPRALVEGGAFTTR